MEGEREANGEIRQRMCWGNAKEETGKGEAGWRVGGVGEGLGGELGWG